MTIKGETNQAVLVKWLELYLCVGRLGAHHRYFWNAHDVSEAAFDLL
jgi:hypothetical protein